ncbi:unnamed protein product [Cladocopium goreaui]|uniref:Cell surface hyaluronidase (Cel l migration-inducing hyaluronidase 2) (Transmembrane protein 2) n=1 Tax=Cladocopium goreaui TaxID=2562237 RepID=A0A9P1CX59_9DINO|nr:unnamed protein product [Cladocopium goreaui]
MQMARYPVHWHLAGDVKSRATLRNSSLHHNFQRCVTLHGTANAEVQQNVCYETFGHAFYLEDGIETGNVFEKNLVASIRPGGSLCSDWQVASGPRSNLQLGPSGFWITNPNNSFIENHVVDANTGYWFTFLGSNNGASGRYFQDPRSGQGSGSWWFQQEQARTPVKAFRGNAVTSARRGIHIDGRVTGSEDATSLGPVVRITVPPVQAHIDGPIASEARAIWTSGGYIHFKRAIFYNVRVAAAGMPELSSGCFRILDESPPGFVMAFTESLFISGPFSETFFQLYDGGIQVLHSRWIFGEGTRKDFAVAKPKCAFGGNGNPVYLLGSRPLLPKEAADSQRFAWAKDLIPLDHGLSISRPDSFQAHLANFQCIAWASPYINGSYLYFADGLGDTIPTIIAPAMEAVDGMQRIRGEERCAKFLQRTAPRFFCGPAFGSYGLACGSRPWLQCPGAVRNAERWMLQLEPWRSRNTLGEAAETWETWTWKRRFGRWSMGISGS